MKTYKKFIAERNAFEKYLLKKGIKNISRTVRKNPKAFERVKDNISNQIKNLRADPDYKFTSLRRGAENISNRFRDMLTPPGIKPNNISNPTKIRQISTRRANKQSWMGDQKSQLSKPPMHTDNKLDDVIVTQFPKNVKGKPTTENIPKGAIPDQSKKLDASSKILKFMRKK
tara:strand:- start:558 stop:1073 length:516 start_codon:yes stop_codon:yes gene_type:complete